MQGLYATTTAKPYAACGLWAKIDQKGVKTLNKLEESITSYSGTNKSCFCTLRLEGHDLHWNLFVLINIGHLDIKVTADGNIQSEI